LLYPASQGLVANNYPPLSFVTVAVVSQISAFDSLYIGRVLSMISVLVIAGAVATCVRCFRGAPLSAFLSGVWIAALLPRYYDGYVGQNDPHLLGLALMAVGLTLFLRAMTAGRDPLLGILLMVFAGFYKHSLVATPATAMLWLAIKDHRTFWRVLPISISMVVLGLLACWTVFGAEFFYQLMFPRVHSLTRSLLALDRLVGVAPALVVWGIWVWHDRRSDASRFSSLFVILGLAWFAILKTGAGIGDNAVFELAVASSIALGLAFHNLKELKYIPIWLRTHDRVAIPLMLCAWLLALPNIEVYYLLTDAKYRDQFHSASETVYAEVKRIAGLPQPVVCSVATVCRWAGKRQIFDRFFVAQKMAKHHITEAEALAVLRSIGAIMVRIDENATILPLERRINNLPDLFIAARLIGATLPPSSARGQSVGLSPTCSRLSGSPLWRRPQLAGMPDYGSKT
jgi:hypothetical protein